MTKTQAEITSMHLRLSPREQAVFIALCQDALRGTVHVETSYERITHATGLSHHDAVMGLVRLRLLSRVHGNLPSSGREIVRLTLRLDANRNPALHAPSDAPFNLPLGPAESSVTISRGKGDYRGKGASYPTTRVNKIINTRVHESGEENRGVGKGETATASNVPATHDEKGPVIRPSLSQKA